MRASDLRHRIRLQERGTEADALGQPTTVWKDVASLWAEVLPLSGRELLAGQAIHTEVTHTITIRWQRQFADPLAMAARRILYSGRVFNIHASIDIEERHKVLELTCAEGLNDG
jgi:SPP1 family predicted phage head-tail adaptor